MSNGSDISKQSVEKAAINFSHNKCDYDNIGLGYSFLEKLNETRDQICQVDADTGFTETKGSVRYRSMQVAIEMQARGIKENDKVMICSRSHAEQAVVLLATLAIGAIVAPFYAESSFDDLKAFFLAIKPKMVFCDRRVFGQIEIIIRQSSDVRQCQPIMFEGRFHQKAFEKFLLHKPTDFKNVIINDTKRKMAFLIPSLSSSGITKLICVSHRAISYQLLYADKILSESKLVLSYYPLCWIAQVILVCYSFVSSIIRIIPPVFQEREACKLLNALRIDTAFLGTYYMRLLVNHPSINDYDFSSLKTILVGGSLTQSAEMTRFSKKFSGVCIIQCYGLTEMSGLTCGFPVIDYQTALEKVGSVGKPFPGVKIKVMDKSTGIAVKPPIKGVLYISGPTLMLGYYKNDILTSASIEKGYFKTDDIGHIDEDGYIYIHGRISDYVHMKGHNVLPGKAEEIIMSHPNVQEVVIVGNDQEVVACVVPYTDSDLTENILLNYINDHVPNQYKIDRVKFLQSIPKTPVGKVKKELLTQSVLCTTIEKSRSCLTLED